MQRRVPNFQRRLVTIVSADVAGFSRLTAGDEVETLTTWRAYFRIAHNMAGAHDGRIFGSAGDSFMIEFERPFDAVQFAVAFQSRLARENASLPIDRRMAFQLGINIGDVLIEEDRLFGDEVNIAARLQERADPGGIVVADVVRSHVASRVAYEFQDLGELELYNIPQRVRAYKISMVADATAKRQQWRPTNAMVDMSGPVPAIRRPSRSRRAAVCLSRLRPLAGIRSRQSCRRADRRAGPVALVSIIDRFSSFAFRVDDHPPAHIGKALGARYLVAGKILVDGNRARVTAELRDAENDRLIWSEGYDRETSEFLDVQADIARSIVSTLDSRIDITEQRRVLRRPVADLNTGELVRRGVLYQRSLRREDAEQARRFFNMALDRDPDNLDALIQLSWWHFWHNWTQRGPREDHDEVARLARRALDIDGDDARAHMLIGIAEMMSGRPEACKAPMIEAIRLNPSLSVPRAVIGSAHILSGEPELGIAPLLTAVRLNPHDLYLFHLLGELAVAHYMLGCWDEAIGWCNSSLCLRPGYWYPRAIMIGALARGGQLPRAQAALAEFATRCPSFRPEYVRWIPFVDRTWHDYLLNGMKMAGYAV